MNETPRKEIHTKEDRRWPPSEIPEGPEGAEEAFAADYTRECGACGSKPVVNASGLCGPCTFGEAETIGGNW